MNQLREFVVQILSEARITGRLTRAQLADRLAAHYNADPMLSVGEVQHLLTLRDDPVVGDVLRPPKNGRAFRGISTVSTRQLRIMLGVERVVASGSARVTLQSRPKDRSWTVKPTTAIEYALNDSSPNTYSVVMSINVGQNRGSLLLNPAIAERLGGVSTTLPEGEILAAGSITIDQIAWAVWPSAGHTEFSKTYSQVRATLEGLIPSARV